MAWFSRSKNGKDPFLKRGKPIPGADWREDFNTHTPHREEEGGGWGRREMREGGKRKGGMAVVKFSGSMQMSVADWLLL